jgi:hypothetical protein
MRASHAPPLMLYSVAESLDQGMRVSDKILKCALFLGVIEGDRFKPIGTGFLVMKAHKNLAFQFVVTCQHNILAAGARPLHMRINRLSGGAEVMPEIEPDKWHYHPDSKSRFVDVAVLPIYLRPDFYDIAHIPYQTFLSREYHNGAFQQSLQWIFAHGEPDAVTQVPRGTIGTEAKLALQLQSGNALLGAAQN